MCSMSADNVTASITVDASAAIRSLRAAVTDLVLAEVAEERARQQEQWGTQNHPDGTGFAYLRDHAAKARRECETAFANDRGTWRHILREEYREALACQDPAELRAELVQVAAVAVAWIEAIDRRGSTS